jgi:hypothetical protein
LSNVQVTDTDFVFTGVATSLVAGTSDESDLVTVTAAEGQQWDEAAVSATYAETAGQIRSVSDSDRAYYFGVNPQIDISGYLWNDLDGDGVWDAGEPGQNGWTVYVDRNDDGLLQSGEPWFVTQNDGQHDGAFWFADLPAGSYVVREVLPEAWRQTFPAGVDSSHRVTTPRRGDFGQAAAPNFGNNAIQVIQFITPLSVLRHDAGLADRRFIRPADDPGLSERLSTLAVFPGREFILGDLAFHRQVPTARAVAG